MTDPKKVRGWSSPIEEEGRSPSSPSPAPETQMTKRSRPSHAEVTTTTDDLLKELEEGAKPCVIGDMVCFRDISGVRWQGPILDIRRCGVWKGGGCDGMLIREDAWQVPVSMMPNAGTWAEVPAPWAFIACIAQPQTTAVRLKDCAPVQRGWWHR